MRGERDTAAGDGGVGLGKVEAYAAPDGFFRESGAEGEKGGIWAWQAEDEAGGADADTFACELLGYGVQWTAAGEGGHIHVDKLGPRRRHGGAVKAQVPAQAVGHGADGTDF